MMKALIFDCETSGLVTNALLRLDRQPEMIEFYGAVVDLANGKVIEEYGTLVKPKLEIEKKITDITGITNEMLKDAPTFADVANPIGKIIQTADNAIAHNAPFDQEIVNTEFKRIKRTIKWPKLICTGEQSIHLFGFRPSMQALHERFMGEGFKEAHRAKNDVEALARCCVKMYAEGLL